MFGDTLQEGMLVSLFVDVYGERAGTELATFLSDLQQVKLPFDFVSQMRCRSRPGYRGFEEGMPPEYYYFVPGAKFGGQKTVPANPLDPSFVSTVDGSGLNFGSPIRLKHALTALVNLPPAAQTEGRLGLATATKHLDTVEELLWACIWNPPVSITHPKSESKRSADWSIQFPDLLLHLECKFLPSSWPKAVDGNEFELMENAVAGKASKQLPLEVAPGSIDAVGVTGIAPLDDGWRRLFYHSLQRYSNVQVIILADVVGQMTVFSLKHSLAAEVQRRIKAWRPEEFGGFISIVSHRGNTEQRRKARQERGGTAKRGVSPGLFELAVPSPRARRRYRLPPKEYRYKIEHRSDDGEPTFIWVPPYQN